MKMQSVDEPAEPGQGAMAKAEKDKDLSITRSERVVNAQVDDLDAT